MNKYLWNTFKKTCFNRNFELTVFEYVKKKKLIYQLIFQQVKKPLQPLYQKYVKIKI